MHLSSVHRRRQLPLLFRSDVTNGTWKQYSLGTIPNGSKQARSPRELRD